MNTIKLHKQLLRWLSSTDLEETMDANLKALLTEKELEEIAKRLEIVRLLKEGKTQREVSKQLKVGIATVTRGAKVCKSPIFNKEIK
jgi:TrpR family trp operon transcriptional repressor